MQWAHTPGNLGSWGEVRYKDKYFGVIDLETVDAISESDV